MSAGKGRQQSKARLVNSVSELPVYMEVATRDSERTVVGLRQNRSLARGPGADGRALAAHGKDHHTV